MPPVVVLIAIILSLFTMVSGVAVTTPPSTSLALANYPHIAGTASSLLGLARFAFGGLTAPLVGLGGATNPVPFGLVTVVATLLGVIAYTVLIRRRATAPAHPTGDIPRPAVAGAAR